jgi:hypothetical protein
LLKFGELVVLVVHGIPAMVPAVVAVVVALTRAQFFL